MGIHRQRGATPQARATPMRPKGSGGAAPSGSLPLLRDGTPSRRRGASRSTPRRSERDPAQYPDRLLTGAPESVPIVTRSRYLMGVPLQLTFRDPADPSLFEAVFKEVARLETILSNWRTDSELSRLNRAAGGEAIACSVDLFEAIVRAVSWAEITGGTFDPTVEPVVRRLGLIGDPYDGRPAVAAPASDGPGGDWRNVVIDRTARTVRLRSAGMGLDMGGIGKGIALDAAARVIREAGRDSALLDFGGQVMAIGRPAREPEWTVDVADPDDRDRIVGRVRVHDLSLSTSAPGGRRGPGGDPHIVDPRTGRPAAYTGSVTVAATDATSADVLSTALCVMGADAGLAWARGRDVAALFVWRNAGGALEIRRTQAFKRLQWHESPPERLPVAAAARAGD